MPHPNAIRAQLQHLQAWKVAEVGNSRNFVVKEKKFLQLSQLFQILHFPQNIERQVKLPVS